MNSAPTVLLRLQAGPRGLGQDRPANPTLAAWIDECATHCRPDSIFYCDGSDAENDFLLAEACRLGTLTPLDQEKLPGCYYHRSAANDVARVEQLTFICTPTADDAGPTNNWREPAATRAMLMDLLAGAMRGRTMFVVPYLMGPPGSPMAKVGVELTDSVYVALNLRKVTRMGAAALAALGPDGHDFNRGLHGMLDLDPARRFICHFPQDNAIISVGSGYGGNVLLGKKCFALRVGSYLAQREGWMAEHMLLLAAESPGGRTHYIAAAFPSACGKTNFAMLIPPEHFPGWKIRTIGDDIAWMRPGADGRLWAVNPESGYFGVIPGTNSQTNPNAVATIARDTIYTNTALTDDGGVWWEGKDGVAPKTCTDWQGQRWTASLGTKAAHPNSRFTSPMTNNPALAPEANAPEGVPISAVIFGGRRGDTVPLVYQSFDWTHGVFIGATMASETTAAAAGAVGQVRRDPMAMLPFCGYHMGDYFRHWLDMGRNLSHAPLVFGVNWFRRDGEGGPFLWPGFGENLRVLQWIIGRCEQNAGAERAAVGWVPRREDLDLDGLPGYGEEEDEGRFRRLMAIHPDDWVREAAASADFFEKLAPRLPEELETERLHLLKRLALPRRISKG